MFGPTIQLSLAAGVGSDGWFVFLFIR